MRYDDLQTDVDNTKICQVSQQNFLSFLDTRIRRQEDGKLEKNPKKLPGLNRNYMII